MKYVFLLILALSFCMFGAKAQDSNHEAPSLQLGLSGLSLTRGNLNAKLIAEIIAEKQQEVKVKLIQNSLLSNLDVAGGTYYQFTNQIINTILLESDTELRTRKILENIVNLGFASMYAKYYLDNYSLGTVRTSLDNLFALDDGLTILDSQSYADILGTASKVDGSTGNQEKITKKIKDSRIRNLIWATLVDMASEAIRQNEHLKLKGLMRVSHEGSYYSLNFYHSPPKEFESLQSDLQVIYLDMKAKLDSFVSKVNAIEFLLKETEDLGKVTVKSPFAVDLSAELVAIENLLDTIIDEYKQNDNGALFSELEKGLVEALDYVLRMQNFKTDASKTDVEYNLSEILSFISRSLNPLLTEANQFTDSSLILKKRVLQLGFKLASNELVELIDNGSKFELKGDLFIKMIALVNNFEKVTTYDFFLNSLTDIGELFDNDKIRNTINTITSFVKNYTTISDQNGTPNIQFNVESFLNNLSNLNDGRHRPFAFHFTVGASTLSFFDKPVVVDNEEIYNYSFVGEKIGLKWKLLDLDYLRSHNRGETFKWMGRTYIRRVPASEPTVSNIHLLLYGSGILYNLVNTGSSKNFNSPILGLGLGITFFNDLDFELSTGIPVIEGQEFRENFNHGFVSIGFDIRFIDYFNRLQKKRRQQKSQERLQNLALSTQQLSN